MSAPSSADVEARLRSLVAALAEQAQCLANARRDLARSEQQWRHQAEQTVAAAATAAQQQLKRDRKAIEANVSEAGALALDVATKAVQQQAPTHLSADWASDVWTDLPPAKTGEWLRVGSVAAGAGRLPLVLPLSAGVWRVFSPDPATFKTFVQNAIARVMAAFDPPRVRVVAYDPDLTLDLAAFAGLRTVSPLSLPPAITAEDDFERALDGLRTDIAAVDDRLTAAGQDTYWGALAAGHALATTIPLRLLVIGGGAASLTDRGLARLDQLRRVAADRGLLVIESVAALAPVSTTPSDASITLGGASATASCVPGVTWLPDPWAGELFVRSLCAKLVDRPRQNLAPTVDFEQILARITDPWLVEADEGLEAVIGRADDGDLVVRLRAENPPMPNALIGGAVGQGKSNLLLVLIHSLAATYSPAELEMVLVDLRDGVEFARLGPTASSPTWLPHVRALGLEFDPDYSLGVLRWVLSQMTERSSLLKANGAATLRQYHQNTGKALPRLLVVIDEFQRLFEGDDDQAAEAAALLENIARTGRGFGVHLVLASQAVTGIRGLATKADAIFAQFHNRITLKNTAAESQAFLTAHNLRAAELEHRGEVVVNAALGAVDKNKVGTVAYADAATLARLKIQLFRQGHGSAPSVFRASSCADWPADWAVPSAPNGISAAVGLPIAVEARPRTLQLSRSPNQGLAVVGADRQVCVPVLVRALATATASLGAGARITILDGDSPGEVANAWVGGLVGYLGQGGATVERVRRDGVAARIIELGAQKGSVTDLVVAVALDAVDLGTPSEPDYLIPSDSLRELVKNGSLNGTWIIGWWQSKTILEEHLGYRAPGLRAWAFAGVSRDDLTDIAGHAVREPQASPRFVWFDRTAGRGAERLVPFEASDVLGPVDLD